MRFSNAAAAPIRRRRHGKACPAAISAVCSATYAPSAPFPAPRRGTLAVCSCILFRSAFPCAAQGGAPSKNWDCGRRRSRSFSCAAQGVHPHCMPFYGRGAVATMGLHAACSPNLFPRSRSGRRRKAGNGAISCSFFKAKTPAAACALPRGRFSVFGAGGQTGAPFPFI